VEARAAWLAGTRIALMNSPGASVVSTCGVEPGRDEAARAHGARADGTHDVELCVERDQRDAEVAGIVGDAVRTAAKQRQSAIDPADRRTAAAGHALVADEGLAAAEIGAARALHQIAPNIAMLRSCCEAARHSDSEIIG
jgi:hypothetical protein